MKDQIFLKTIVLLPIVHIIYEGECLVDALNLPVLLNNDEVNRYNLEIDYEIAALNGAKLIVYNQGITGRLLNETIDTLKQLYYATTTINCTCYKNPRSMIEGKLSHLSSIIRIICCDNDIDYNWLRREVEENE